MDIVFNGRHTDVLERFRKHATGKLAKVEKLDHKAIRVDVEVSTERNPRQSGRKERVELTITTRGPAIRAEAAAEDRFAALDLALAKLESRLRRACDRRKAKHSGPASVRVASAEPGRPSDGGLSSAAAGPLPVPRTRQAPEADGAGLHQAGLDGAALDSAALDGAARNGAPLGVVHLSAAELEVAGLDGAPPDGAGLDGAGLDSAVMPDDRVAIEMQGQGPLVVREKFHVACPMSIDQALFEMELVGHDFFLFTDATDGLPSVVYRRQGYQYGVIRLVEEVAPAEPVQEVGQADGARERAVAPGR